MRAKSRASLACPEFSTELKDVTTSFSGIINPTGDSVIHSMMGMSLNHDSNATPSLLSP